MSQQAASTCTSPARVDSEAADCRCLCGSLLARWVEDGVELKCRRCKRTLRVPLPPAARDGVARPIPVIPVAEG